MSKDPRQSRKNLNELIQAVLQEIIPNVKEEFVESKDLKDSNNKEVSLSIMDICSLKILLSSTKIIVLIKTPL